MALNDWSALVDPIPARSQPSIPHTSLPLETFFPGHITRTSLFPPILIAIAHTRAQTAAQRSNNQSTCSSQRQRTSPADACRKSTPGHPAAQRQFSKARNQARRTQLPTSTTLSPQVRLPTLVFYGSEVNVGSTGSAGACPEQRAQAQAINRTRTRGQPRSRSRPEATTDIPSTSHRNRIWRAGD